MLKVNVNLPWIGVVFTYGVHMKTILTFYLIMLQSQHWKKLILSLNINYINIFNKFCISTCGGSANVK